ncbi:tissue factor isoform X2 [Hyla sarda]|uniref:tissue factor isoform X2 n=1 Tax=Hyla sarda TaxID=327740 RepID=UPI0024C2CCDA|nr:tissue factor isoform X2 [Hyla sarda]
MRCLYIVLMVTMFCWRRSCAQVLDLPTATDIKWSSINFKTILDWSPEPTNYTYTVLVRSPFTDWIKKCINTRSTTCDVTDLMKDVRSTYEVRISSEIRSTDVEEFPYAEGPTFTPYEQTIIGKPKIQNFSLSDDQSRLTVVVSDTRTPYKYDNNNTYMTLRDVFQNDFIYTLFYRKASSTGKKQESSSTNEIAINTDKGESYCFYVQTSVKSRKQNRVSQNSDELCTPSDGGAGFLPSIGVLFLSNLILLSWWP